MFVNFFIDRPIFASVLAMVIVVAGAVAIPFLPIAMFPEITPPQVVVAATYPGASAEVVEQTVTTPIESPSPPMAPIAASMASAASRSDT